jgi:hypothetical protein
MKTRKAAEIYNMRQVAAMLDIRSQKAHRGGEFDDISPDGKPESMELGGTKAGSANASDL